MGGGGGPNSDDWRKSLTICRLCGSCDFLMESEESDPVVSCISVVAVVFSGARWLSVLSNGCCLLETLFFIFFYNSVGS